MFENKVKRWPPAMVIIVVLIAVLLLWLWRRPNFSEKDARKYVEHYVGSEAYRLSDKPDRWTLTLSDYPDRPIKVMEEFTSSGDSFLVFLDKMMNISDLRWNYEEAFKEIYSEAFSDMKAHVAGSYRGKDEPAMSWNIEEANLCITISFSGKDTPEADYKLVKEIFSYYRNAKDIPFLKYRNVNVQLDYYADNSYLKEPSGNGGENSGEAVLSYFDFGILAGNRAYMPDYEIFKRNTENYYSPGAEYPIKLHYIFGKEKDKIYMSEYQWKNLTELKNSYIGKEGEEFAEDKDNVLAALQQKYPQYFDLEPAVLFGSKKGVSLYVCKDGDNRYSCGLLPGDRKEHGDEEIEELMKNSLTIEEAKLIESYYRINSGTHLNWEIIPIAKEGDGYSQRLDKALGREIEDRVRQS